MSEREREIETETEIEVEIETETETEIEIEIEMDIEIETEIEMEIDVSIIFMKRPCNYLRLWEAVAHYTGPLGGLGGRVTALSGLGFRVLGF